MDKHQSHSIDVFKNNKLRLGFANYYSYQFHNKAVFLLMFLYKLLAGNGTRYEQIY